MLCISHELYFVFKHCELYGPSTMPFVLDIPTRIPPAGVTLHLICVDVNRPAPLLYLAHASPSGHQVYVAQLAWSYLATSSMLPASFSSIPVYPSAPGRVVLEVARDPSASGLPSTSPTSR